MLVGFLAFAGLLWILSQVVLTRPLDGESLSPPAG